ncbi:rhomboid family intramembrane serine protease [Zoogloea sp.]|uniref:rhomboid family intramembrane serine protease n=1 Tax=Zoogloea sp. TaxID=49181 RepID=UPI0014156B40|nr:MAG: rhomboid family intramembrane serine protease [Zoogloea sp.]
MPAERALLAALVMLVASANLLPGEAVEWSRSAIGEGQWWRLWTGQFCHWSPLHLAGNLAAVGAITLITGQGIRRWLCALPLAAPLLSLFLLASAPALTHYRGLSGLVGVLIVGAALDGGIIGRLLGLGYLARLGFDAVSGSHSPLLPDGIATTWQAHLGGILLGVVTAAGLRWGHAGRRSGS